MEVPSMKIGMVRENGDEVEDGVPNVDIKGFVDDKS